MPLVIWGAVALAGVVATGWTADRLAGAAEEGAKLTRWVVIGGTVYAGYRVAQASGLAK